MEQISYYNKNNLKIPKIKLTILILKMYTKLKTMLEKIIHMEVYKKLSILIVIMDFLGNSLFIMIQVESH